MDERNDVVWISRLLVDGLLVPATDSYVNSFLGIIGFSELILDILEDYEDEQQEDDEDKHRSGGRNIKR